MIVSITLVKYKRFYIPFALLAMALHRLPLMLNKKCLFWKLMGCGKNAGFSMKPDWQLWATLAVWKDYQDLEHFQQHSWIADWWKKFSSDQWTLICEPLTSHGQWTGKEPFKQTENSSGSNYAGPVAVITRARIRPSKIKRFWSSVAKVASIMSESKGYVASFSMGEAPLYLQATLSVWESMDDVVNFAYHSAEHREVIKKTRDEDWYSEELFARFKPVASIGTINNKRPLGNIKLPDSNFNTRS